MRPHEKHLGGYVTAGCSPQNKGAFHAGVWVPREPREARGISVFQSGASYHSHSGGKGHLGLSPLCCCLRSQMNRARLRTGAGVTSSSVMCRGGCPVRR